jgi:GH25 family lysozyme M1 (1,4-beta-N-acetylmuramidase)
MESTVHPTLRRFLAAASIAVTTIALTAGTASAAQERPTPATPAPAAQGASWAHTVTGKIVPVTPTRAVTPLHPQKITHPRLDYMGSTIAAHDKAAATPKAGAIRPAASVPQLPGIDVSDYQGDINWASIAGDLDFVYAKASEGTYYTNPDFDNQYEGPYDEGLIRGSYEFANPADASGTADADYFIANGGGWSGDGKTLPGALDIEYDPYSSNECYSLTQSQMVTWIKAFVTEYAAKEHVYPVIYSTTDWWTSCTGNSTAFSSLDPLWIANYTASGGGTLPAGWGFYTFWQYADSGSLPGDQDVFNGAYAQLQTLATKG